MKPQRLTVWCAINVKSIIGRNFLTGNITGNSQAEMLRDFFIPTFQGMNLADESQYMQDGALPHRRDEVFELLYEHFQGRVIRLGHNNRFNQDIDWPFYSPDLNPCDYYLWEYLKDAVYRERLGNIAELRIKIETTINAIPSSVLTCVIENLTVGLKKVVDRESGHIEPFLTGLCISWTNLQGGSIWSYFFL